jgi:ribosomal protein L29
MMMKRKDGNTGFWEPGFSIFTNELGKQEKAKLEPLKSEMKATTNPGRKAELRQLIADIKTEFKTKRKNARYSLFAKG